MRSVLRDLEHVGSVFDVFVMIGFGVLGLDMRRLDIPLAPLLLTLVLGPLMERSLRESLDISQGDFTIFLTRPITVWCSSPGVVVRESVGSGAVLGWCAVDRQVSGSSSSGGLAQVEQGADDDEDADDEQD